MKFLKQIKRMLVGGENPMPEFEKVEKFDGPAAPGELSETVSVSLIERVRAESEKTAL